MQDCSQTEKKLEIEPGLHQKSWSEASKLLWESGVKDLPQTTSPTLYVMKLITRLPTPINQYLTISMLKFSVLRLHLTEGIKRILDNILKKSHLKYGCSI